MEKVVNPQIVLCGDSIGCSFKMKIRLNSYGNLLSRRLNKTYAADYVTGADTTILLQTLASNDKIINDVKNAEVILLTVGGNNVIIAFLEAFIRALDLGPLGARTLPQIGRKLKEDKLAGLKIIKEFLSKKTKDDVKKGVHIFEKEYPLVIKKIKELNPNVTLIAQTVCNPFETVRDIVFLGMSSQVKKPVKMMNKVIFENADNLGYIVADTASALIAESHKNEVTNMKRKDIHLTDFGHSVAYKTIYSALINKRPEFSCEEAKDVYKTLETLTKEEREAQELEDKMTSAALGETDEEGLFIQPQDFSDGPLKEYNEWFGEVDGMKFYPLKKAGISFQNVNTELSIGENIVMKNDDDSINAYNVSGQKIGKIIDEQINDNAPDITESFKNGLRIIAKVIKTDENPEIVVAIYPTYEYYKKTAENN